MIVHETQPYLTRIGGHWKESQDGQVLLVGGVDKWVCPPPEHHEDTCPCLRCDSYRKTMVFTRDQIENTEVLEEYKEPELTPEDLERLRGGG